MGGILIGCVSAAGFEERRRACEETWMASARRVGMPALFVVGGASEVQFDGVTLHCPCPDTYPELPQKTRWLCRWLLEAMEFDFLFKCDDDTYVHAGRLAQFEIDGEYVGHDMGGYASGGAGYLLSRRAVEIVARHLVDLDGAEDLLVGLCLANAGINVAGDQRFHPWNNCWPTPENDLITSHHCSPEQMRVIQSGFFGSLGQ